MEKKKRNQRKKKEEKINLKNKKWKGRRGEVNVKITGKIELKRKKRKKKREINA